MNDRIRNRILPCLIALASAVCVASAAAQEPAKYPPKPIPTGADAYTMRKFSEDLFQIQKRDIDRYSRTTDDPAEIRPRVLKFLEAACWAHLPSPKVFFKEPLGAVGDQLIKSGSRDPWVAAWTAHYLIDNGRLEDLLRAEALIRDCTDRMDRSNYSSWIKFHLALTMWEVADERHLHDHEAEQKWRTATAARLAKWMIDDSIAPMERRLVWHFFRPRIHNVGITDSQSEFHRVCDDLVKPDIWFYNLLEGEMNNDEAWYERGYDVNPTSEDERQRAAELHRIAAMHLTKSWDIHTDWHEAACEMIHVAQAGGTEQSPREWFDRAVAATVDFEGAYGDMISSLRKTGGQDSLLKFAGECLGTRRFDTEVPLFGFQIVNQIHNRQRGPDGLLQDPDNYALAVEVLQALANEPTRADETLVNSQNHFRTMLVDLGLHAGREDDARRELDQLGDKLDREGLRWWDTPYQTIVARLYARTGKSGEAVKKLEESLNQPENRRDPAFRARAVEELAAAQRDADPQAAPFFSMWRNVLRIENDFDKGGWIDLMFSPDILTWRQLQQQNCWEVLDESTVCLRVNGGYMPILYLVAPRFTAPYEVEFDVQQRNFPRYEPKGGIGLGRILRSEVTESDGKMGRFFRLGAKFGRAGKEAEMDMGISSTLRAGLSGDAQFPGLTVTHVRIQAWPGHHAMFRDGVLCLVGDDPKFDPTGPLFFFGWGSIYHDQRFSNLRIRKLDAAPVDPHSSRQALVASYIDRQQHGGSEALLSYAKGLAEAIDKKFPAAIAAFEKAASPDVEDAVLSLDLGNAYFRSGKFAEAQEKLEHAAAAKPEYFESHAGLARFRAACPEEKFRDAKAAIEQAARACELSHNESALALSALAAAQAEAGHFDDAVAAAEKALKLAPRPERSAIEAELKQYQSKQPLRIEPVKPDPPPKPVAKPQPKSKAGQNKQAGKKAASKQQSGPGNTKRADKNGQSPKQENSAQKNPTEAKETREKASGSESKK